MIPSARPCASSHSSKEPGPLLLSICVRVKSEAMHIRPSYPRFPSLTACTATAGSGCMALSSAMETLNIRPGSKPRASKRTTSARRKASWTSEASMTRSRRGSNPVLLCNSTAAPSSSASAFRRKRAPQVRQSSTCAPSGNGSSSCNVDRRLPAASLSSSSARASRSREPIARRQDASNARVLSPVRTHMALMCSLNKEAASHSRPSTSLGRLVGAGRLSRSCSMAPEAMGPRARYGSPRNEMNSALSRATRELQSRAAISTNSGGDTQRQQR
mmetsp:Transcript_114109/g.355339  ORF Transcript_114109/g.355339 Transcript_114109/m.355339 type:complete len:273 (+) Transcript_114109:228-1046(+)